MAATVRGDTKTWHSMSLDFNGPQRSENADTFSDFRLDVTFTNSATGTKISVPGFFAADGKAAMTSATSGDVWRVNFTPPEKGAWTYKASFRAGDNVAASIDPFAGKSAGFMDGVTGRFDVTAAAPASAVDLRGHGTLSYVGDQYAEFANTGDPYLKMGSNSPENFLAYAGFDDTIPSHYYKPHLQDWNTGDPTWKNGKGKEMIGALNYLADEGVNALYMITMTAAGDGRDAWPWVGDSFKNIPRFSTSMTEAQKAAARTYDVSKLAQWDIAFDHAQKQGIVLHLVLQENENDDLLNNGNLGIERAIYYREMVARFSHHNGVIWNLGEETRNSTAQLMDAATRLKALNPYDHPVVVHTFPGKQAEVYKPLLGFKNIDGVSLQVSEPEKMTADWLKASAAAGRPWIAFWDETGPANDGVMPDNAVGAAANHKEIREDLWQMLFQGGAGAEWYFGYAHAHNDLTLQDFRSRDTVWDWSRAAKDFFVKHLPFDEMSPASNLVSGSARAFAKNGDVYAVYLPFGGGAAIDLRGVSGQYSVEWYDPRNGGELISGAVKTVTGGGSVSLGAPPKQATADWVVLITRVDGSSGGTGGSSGGGTGGGSTGSTIQATASKEAFDGSGGAKTFVFDQIADSTRKATDVINNFGTDDKLDLSGVKYGKIVYDAGQMTGDALLVRSWGDTTQLNFGGWGDSAFQLQIKASQSVVLAALGAGGGTDGGAGGGTSGGGSTGSKTIVADSVARTYVGAPEAETFVFTSKAHSTRSATDVIKNFEAEDTIDLRGLGVTRLETNATDLNPGEILIRTWGTGDNALTRINVDGYKTTDFQLDVYGNRADIVDSLLF